MFYIYFYLLLLLFFCFKARRVEDMISLLQFQKKHLIISCLIHQCGKFVVKLGEDCSKPSPPLLHNLELFLLETIRDLTWVLTHALGILEAYLLDPILSEGCVESTRSICLQVMELSGSVISHLLNFGVQAFNKCNLLTWLKNMCRYWLNHFSQAECSLGL